MGETETMDQVTEEQSDDLFDDVEGLEDTEDSPGEGQDEGTEGEGGTEGAESGQEQSEPEGTEGTGGSDTPVAEKEAAPSQEVVQMRQQLSGLQRERDALAQYRQQNDSTINDLKELADMAGVDISTYLTALKENVLVAKGMNREAAKEMVARQREQAQQKAQAALQQQRRQQEIENRRNADINAWLEGHKDVDPKTIPQSVWEDVRKGDTLVNAYGRYELQQLKEQNARLQQQLKTQEQNARNKAASVGSMRSAGTKDTNDTFMTGFDSVF